MAVRRVTELQAKVRENCREDLIEPRRERREANMMVFGGKAQLNKGYIANG